MQSAGGDAIRGGVGVDVGVSTVVAADGRRRRVCRSRRICRAAQQRCRCGRFRFRLFGVDVAANRRRSDGWQTNGMTKW